MSPYPSFPVLLRDDKPTILAVPLPSLIEAAAGAQAVNRSSVAALAFLVWDICITLDEEVKLVWPKPWTLIKFLFFFVRYVPVMMQISILFVGTELTPHFHFTPHDCFIWQVYQGVASITIVMAVDVILMLRVFALYNGRFAVRVVVGIFFSLEAISMCVGVGLAMPGITYNDICVVTSVPITLLIYGAASIFFQVFLFVLTAVQFAIAVRVGWGNVPLIESLMKDGTWAFFILFVVMVADASLYGLNNHAFAGVLYGWILTAFSLAGYRILLNLQHLSPEHETHTSRRKGSSLRFATQVISGQDLESPRSCDVTSLSGTSSTSSLSSVGVGQ